MAGIRNDAMVQNLTPDFRQLNNPAHAWADALAMALTLPGLVGFWPGNTQGSAANIGDLADLGGREKHLSRNSLPLTRAGTGSLVAWQEYDGTDDYFSHVDNASFDILGNEGRIHSSIRGLTMINWVWFDTTAAAFEMIMAKRGAAGNVSYSVGRQATGTIRFTVSGDGTALTLVDSSAILAAERWYFTAARYKPSSEVKTWVNSSTTLNTTSIPATIFDSSAAFEIGAFSGGTLPLNGRICLSILCEAALPDIFVDTFFQFTSPLFGVKPT